MNLDEKLAIKRRLEELTERGKGRLTPEAVVEDAKNKKSPLHSHIFYDSDAEAAHEQRLERARGVIRTVRVNMTIDSRQVSVVGYVHDPGSREQGYVPTATLVDEKDRALEVVLREFARIESIINRSREIADVLGLRAQLEGMLENVQQLTEAARRSAA